ncbi:MAG: hypothetical protein RLZZ77_610 [Bacteroidota bacterium]|jgi:hypothetical protein
MGRVRLRSQTQKGIRNEIILKAASAQQRRFFFRPTFLILQHQKS